MTPLSVITTGGIGYWAQQVFGAYDSSGKGLFSWHPLLMSVGTLLLLPHGLRVQSSTLGSRVTRGRVHGAVMTAGFLVMNGGIWAAYASHRAQQVANWATVHAWVGIGGVALLKSNVFGGALKTLAPGWKVGKVSAGVHASVGRAAVAVSFVAAVCGLAEAQAAAVARSGRPFEGSALAAGALAGAVLVVGGLALARRGKEAGAARAAGEGAAEAQKVRAKGDDVDSDGFA